jgi:hypothetical protein
MNQSTTDEESSCTPRGEFISLDEKVSSGQELAVIFNKMTRLLKETRRKTMDAPIEIFGDFYHQLRSFHDDEAVTMAYEDWKMNVGKLTFECLKEKQTQTVAEFLEKGVLRHSRVPSERELAEVRLDLVRMHMPCRYRYSKNFKLQCAIFRRFISWDGDILIIDYDSYGKYLFQFFFSLTYEERLALFILDRTLQLIHEDMVKVMKEEKRLPDELKDTVYWKRLQESNFVDNNFMLCADTSRKQAMYIADVFADKLKLKARWKLFEDFWGIKKLAQEKWEMQQTGVLPTRYQEIDRIFSE